MGVTLRYFSYPAVSQICSFALTPDTGNSIMRVMKVGEIVVS